MNRRLILLSAAMMAPAGLALAQGTLPPGPQLTGVTPDAEDFVVAAGHADVFEIGSSQLLLLGSTHPQIRAYAQRMVEAHALMLAERLAMPDAIIHLGTGTDNAKQRKLIELRGLQGDELNRTYVQAQVEAHRENERLYEIYSIGGIVPALKAYAVRHLPTIRLHLQEALALQVRRDE